MNIALVIDRFQPGRGGAERSLVRILSALHARGHALQLCARDWDEPLPVPMRCHRVAVAGFPRWRRDWSFANRSASLIQELAPDLVLGVRHTWVMDVFLARGGLYCETLEGNRRANPSRLNLLGHRLSPKHRMLLALERRLFDQPDPPLVIAPSEMVKRHCVEHFALPAERAVVVHTGADLEQFQPASAETRRRLRETLGLNDEVAVLFAAHNFRLKGLFCLLEAWRRLDSRRFRLLVAGRGRPPGPAAGRPGVQFLGDRPDMRELYQAADVLAHPTFYDPFSRVVIEAMACGLPAITTRFNGAAEILTDGREGFVLDDPRQTDVLAERIGRFADAGRQAEFSRMARRRAEQCPESAFLEQTVAAIETEARRRHEARKR